MLGKSMVTIAKRGMRRGFNTLLRERQWLTALGAFFGIMMLVQMLVLVLTGLEGMQSVLRSRTDLRLEIRAEAADGDIQEFYSALGQQPYVENTVYITKETAYEQTRRTDPELIAFLEEFNIQNPFTDTIGVTLASLDNYEQLTAFAEQSRWQSVVNPTFMSDITDQEQHVYALLGITHAGRSLTMLILLITGFALVFITTELVRRRALSRSDEVLVERLVGAAPFSIALPFITEAVILLLVAIAASSLLLVLLITLLPMLVPALQTQGVLGSLRAEVTPLLSTVLPMMLLIEVLVAPLIATLGAWLGIYPQVHSPRISFAI